ncbi:MAG TPA: YbaN family protein [Desulfurivibrionaceae bacterium]|nr:YbaN family protein [Desulfurivibrionaceae bacterium]
MVETRNPVARIALIVLGLLCLGIACLGFALPGLPGTPFLLLAAACFARSSHKLYNRLLTNKLFGPLLTNWQQTRSIPRRVKQIAILSVLAAGGLSLATVDNTAFRVTLPLLLSVPLIILARLRETESLATAEE